MTDSVFTGNRYPVIRTDKIELREFNFSSSTGRKKGFPVTYYHSPSRNSFPGEVEISLIHYSHKIREQVKILSHLIMN